MKIALVTGVTGQDGAYISELLLSKGYKVVGTARRTSTSSYWRLKYLDLLEDKNFILEEMDLTDLSSISSLLKKYKPDEFYNLAAQSFVASSFISPLSTSQITGIGVNNILESIRITKPDTKFYQASTSEMFGKAQEIPQRETTPFYPRSPYGVSKLYAHWLTVNYRESYDMFASSGILFNHESPLRGLEFVTRKITSSIVKLKKNLISDFQLGNLEAKRDWGYAKDFVEGIYKILQNDEPDTFVLATGKTFSVRDFLNLCFDAAELEVIWEGKGINEKVFLKSSGKEVVSINKKYFRPAEVDLLIGDPSKAKSKLNWEASCSLEELCQIMIEAEFDFYENKKNIFIL